MEAIYEHVLLSNDTGERLVLQNAPIGWDEQKFNLIRDLRYFGIFKKISVEYQFVGDGYKLLQRHKQRKGVDANVILRVYKDHVFLFEGKVNFFVGKDIRKNRKFQVDIIQSDFVQKFQTREDMKLNVLNDISLDRKTIDAAVLKEATVRGRQILFFSEFVGSVTDDADIYTTTLPFLLKSNGNDSVNTGSYTIVLPPFTEEEVDTIHERIYNTDSALYVNKLVTPQTLTINFKANVSIVYLGEPLPILLFGIGDLVMYLGYRIVFRIVIVDGDSNIVETLYEQSFVDTHGNFDLSYSGTFEVPVGHMLAFACERWSRQYFYNDGDLENIVEREYQIDGGDAGDVVGTRMRTEVTYNELSLTVSTDSVVPDTVNSVLLPHELFSNLIAQINGGKFYSDFFGRTDIGYAATGKGALLGITTGAILRGIPTDEIQIPTSFRDAFTSYSSVWCLGAIVQKDGIIVEPLAELFNSDIATDLGEVRDLVTTPAPEFLFNSVLAGYPKNEYEQDNGRDEPNTQIQFSNSLNAAKKELLLMSVYYGDGYGIEFARRLNIKFTGSKDSRYDDKIFFIDLVDDGSGGYMSRRLEGILLAEGVFSPETSMNLTIAVEQNMIRWGKFLNIAVDKKADKNYYPQSKDKNNKLHLVTEDLGETRSGDPILAGASAYFIPEERQFESPIKLHNLFEILANPLGLVKYKYEDEDFFDYLFEVDMETEKHTGPWRMLATKDSPVQITDEIWGNFLKYGVGPTDYIRWSTSSQEAVLLYK